VDRETHPRLKHRTIVLSVATLKTDYLPGSEDFAVFARDFSDFLNVPFSGPFSETDYEAESA
jgi:hypothetical protein